MPGPRIDPTADPPPAARAPSLAIAVPLQLLALREPLRRWRERHRLAAAPRGAGLPVLVLPGMGVGDLSTRPLRRFLRQHDFDARPWRLGRHRPDVPSTIARLLPRLEEYAVERESQVALVGWSLGGLVAREVARMRPDLVRRVITLGSPVVGGLRHTAIAGLFRLQGWDIAEIERRVAAANQTPIRVPVTAIWSRRDGIVDWRACVDRETPTVENLEATSCHWGLGLDPDVLAAIAERLARADS
ncbi:MAG: alpha/beta hydrolase [Thermoanaerobaculia bacterium]